MLTQTNAVLVRVILKCGHKRKKTTIALTDKLINPLKLRLIQTTNIDMSSFGTEGWGGPSTQIKLYLRCNDEAWAPMAPRVRSQWKSFLLSLSLSLSCSSVPLGCAQTLLVITHGILGVLACIITGDDKQPAGGRTQFSFATVVELVRHSLASWTQCSTPPARCHRAGR